MSNGGYENEWRKIAGEGLNGYLSFNRGDHVILGPLDAIRVDADGEIFVLPKWLAVQGIDRYGQQMRPCHRVHNHASNPGIAEDRLSVTAADGRRVARYGVRGENTIHFDVECPVAPADVEGLVLDDEGRERATWGLLVPGLVQADAVQLVQHFEDRRGDVVNDHPSTWTFMLFQGVKSYLGDESFPKGTGDERNEEFRIRLRLRVEPHLVALGCREEDKLLPTLVKEAFERMAAAWGGVNITWGEMLDYGVYNVEITHLINAFRGGVVGDNACLLGFDHPTKLSQADGRWDQCSYFLARHLEDEIRRHLDADLVANHLNQHGAPCPILP